MFRLGKKIFVEGPPPPGIARNCYGYAAGGMPLTFTQEDFLVLQFLFGLYLGSNTEEFHKYLMTFCIKINQNVSFC